MSSFCKGIYNTDVHREALEACVAHTNMKYVSYKSGTRSFIKVSILKNLGIVRFLISEYRDTFEVSVHRATLVTRELSFLTVCVHLRHN